MRAKTVIGFLVLCAACVWGQSAAIVGGGFVSPVTIPAAPGGILTIYVAGLATSLSQPVTASSFPLPYALAGISAAITQFSRSLAAPLLSVFPVSTCTSIQTGGCSRLTGITLEIPYEMMPNSPFLQTPPVYTQLTITQGAQTAVVDLDAEFDSIHVLRSGDSITQPGSPVGVGTGDRTFLRPIVTHSDGTLVDDRHPVRPGETLVMYAVGLGPTTPAVATGDKSLVAAAARPITIGFVYLAAGASQPAAEAPLFDGLTPGFAGLYQINFVVPAAPASLQLCSQGGPGSNLTITIFGFSSLDVVGICVQPN